MITNYFIQIHIPRTGGQMIRGLIYGKNKSIKIYDKSSHLSLDKSIEIYKKLSGSTIIPPSFTFVRNPWDWYVSRFFFRYEEVEKNDSIPNVLTESISKDKNGFKKHMKILNI